MFKEYIQTFSSGLVSTKSDIRVVFTFDKIEWQANQEVDQNLFDISPSIKGKVVALSSNILAFVPEEKLKQDTEYRITLKLSKIIKTPRNLSEFKFSIKTYKQDFTLNTQDS